MEKDGKNKIYDWKDYYCSVRVPKNSPLGITFAQKAKESKECFIHLMNYNMFSDPYRKYRRGKNRCRRCGCKVEETGKEGRRWKR